MSSFVIWLVLYSVIGWIYESVLCSVTEKRIVNRGFLNGPYCPIYGCGAVLDILILGRIDNPVLLFFAGMLVTCSLEYFTSWLMEIMFHAKWWDYSTRKFNLNGRICLLGALVFGAFSVVLIKFIHPAVAFVTKFIPEPAAVAVSLALVALITADTIYTVTRLFDFNQKITELKKSLTDIMENPEKYKNEAVESVKGTPEYQHMQQRIEEFTQKLNKLEKRHLITFPKLKYVRSDELVQRVSSYLNELRRKK